jgi:hypothetical protein
MLIDPGKLLRQLQTTLSETDSQHIGAIAFGLGQLLERDPIASALVADQIAPAIAGIYGQLVRLSQDTAANADLHPMTRASAERTLVLMRQVAELAQLDDPEPPKEFNLEDLMSGAVARARAAAGNGGTRDDYDTGRDPGDEAGL